MRLSGRVRAYGRALEWPIFFISLFFTDYVMIPKIQAGRTGTGSFFQMGIFVPFYILQWHILDILKSPNLKQLFENLALFFRVIHIEIFLPAVESSSGPLGSGLSQATGMALAAESITANLL